MCETNNEKYETKIFFYSEREVPNQLLIKRDRNSGVGFIFKWCILKF